MRYRLPAVLAGLMVFFLSPNVDAQDAGAAASYTVSFKDPAGDDDGPGTYTYPTDAVYKKGSFDMVQFDAKSTGAQVSFKTTLNAALEDPWSFGNGFSLQMIFVFIDTDGKPGTGHMDAPPGLNVRFSNAGGWEKCVIICPQAPQRVRSEIKSKAAAMEADLLIPDRVKGAGRVIDASIRLSDLGNVDLRKCNFQVAITSCDGFPAGEDLLTRKVNEYEGQHRFGGGDDMDCDPHIMDCLAGNGAGEATEAQLQHSMLKYECSEEGKTKKSAELRFIAPRK